jgi:hypothetical protein
MEQIVLMTLLGSAALLLVGHVWMVVEDHLSQWK